MRLLRPLLTVPPGRLRATLRAAGVAWVEDPSNADASALRARLRRARGDAAGEGVLTRAAGEAAAARGAARAAAERAVADELAARVRLYPEGYAVLAPGRGVGGGAGGVCCAACPARRMRRRRGRWRRWPAVSRPATLGGVRVQPAGRLGPGWLLTREVAALAPPVPARPGAVWDGRFRLAAGRGPAARAPNSARSGRPGRRCGACRRPGRCPPPCWQPCRRCGVHGGAVRGAASAAILIR